MEFIIIVNSAINYNVVPELFRILIKQSEKIVICAKSTKTDDIFISRCLNCWELQENRRANI